MRLTKPGGKRDAPSRSRLWLSFGAVFPLELLAALGVMLVTGALVLQYAPGLIIKAKMSEIYYLLMPQRYELVESLAHSGEPIELDSGNLRDGGTAPKSAAAEEMLSGRRVERRSAEAPKGPDISQSADIASQQKAVEAKRADREKRAAEGGGQGKYVTGVRIVETTIVATVRLDGNGPTHEFALYPAVSDSETPAVYAWLCGRQLPPPGLLARPPAVRTTLPNSLLLSECRRRREA